MTMIDELYQDVQKIRKDENDENENENRMMNDPKRWYVERKMVSIDLHRPV